MTIIHALIALSGCLGILFSSLFLLHTSMQTALLGQILWLSLCVLHQGNSPTQLLKAALSGIKRGHQAYIIFLLIGMLIAALIQSGAIATLIYYGAGLIQVKYFLVSMMIMASIMSIATGSAWTTVACLGPIGLSISSTMFANDHGLLLSTNVAASLTAGAIISGASFGDKMSPLSDTTNLAAMAVSISVKSHIKGMLTTTSVAFMLALLLYWQIGIYYSSSASLIDNSQLPLIKTGLAQQFSITPLSLIPVAFLSVATLSQQSAIRSMLYTILIAFFTSHLLQGDTIAHFFDTLINGYTSNSSMIQLNQILNRGGLISMLPILELSIAALALGGILHRFGYLQLIVRTLLGKINHSSSLVPVTILSCIIANIAMAEAYLSIVMNGQLLRQKYQQLNLPATLLSRSLEEGATLTTGLIPWTTAGAFYCATLNLSPWQFAPFTFFNLISPLVGILFAVLGIASTQQYSQQLTKPSDIHKVMP